MRFYNCFSRDRRGVAAVEFAILAPVIIIPLFLGLVEILTLYRSEAKLSALTTNVAQMVSFEAQTSIGDNLVAVSSSDITASTLANTSLQDICQGAIQGLAPFPATGTVLAIASVTLESNSQGLPASSGSTTYAWDTATPTYDVWEADFNVSGSTCTATTPTAVGTTKSIGVTNAESLSTTTPPATGGPTGSSTAWNGMLAVPCDNAIIVKATMAYPGLTYLNLASRPTLTQTSFNRWANAWNQAELKCSGTASGDCTAQYTTTQVCVSTNTATN